MLHSSLSGNNKKASQAYDTGCVRLRSILRSQTPQPSICRSDEQRLSRKLSFDSDNEIILNRGQSRSVNFLDQYLMDNKNQTKVNGKIISSVSYKSETNEKSRRNNSTSSPIKSTKIGEFYSYPLVKEEPLLVIRFPSRTPNPLETKSQEGRMGTKYIDAMRKGHLPPIPLPVSIKNKGKKLFHQDSSSRSSQHNSNLSINHCTKENNELDRSKNYNSDGDVTNSTLARSRPRTRKSIDTSSLSLINRRIYSSEENQF